MSISYIRSLKQAGLSFLASPQLAHWVLDDGEETYFSPGTLYFIAGVTTEENAPKVTQRMLQESGILANVSTDPATFSSGASPVPAEYLDVTTDPDEPEQTVIYASFFVPNLTFYETSEIMYKLWGVRVSYVLHLAPGASTDPDSDPLPSIPPLPGPVPPIPHIPGPIPQPGPKKGDRKNDGKKNGIPEKPKTLPSSEDSGDSSLGTLALIGFGGLFGYLLYRASKGAK